MGFLIRALPVTYQGDIGTLTWSAISDPTTITKKYTWTRNGNLVTIYCKINATNAGLTVTAVQFPLPSDMPVPSTFASQPNNTIVIVGSGAISNGGNPALNTSDGCKMFLDNSGVAQIKIETSAGLSANFAWCTLSYVA